MTEDDAKTKWCDRIALVKAVEAISGNAAGDCNCIASDCMMWRWGKGDPVLQRNTTSNEHGYCGLGGKP